jgi:hypothetical protein
MDPPFCRLYLAWTHHFAIGTFINLPKIMKIKDVTIPWDRNYETRRAIFPHTSDLSKPLRLQANLIFHEEPFFIGSANSVFS